MMIQAQSLDGGRNVVGADDSAVFFLSQKLFGEVMSKQT